MPLQPSEPQLNLHVRDLLPSATVAINERSDELRRNGRPVYKLGLGQSPFPVPEVVGEELRRHAFEKDYLPVKGLLRLREAVAEHHRRTFQIECTAEDVLVGPGSKELMFLLQLVYQGDIVIPTPAWVSYAPQARIIGRKIQFISTRRSNRWRLTPEELESLCKLDPSRPRLLILNYPSNPTGVTYTSDELSSLAEVARKFGVIVLSDEIYGKVHHDGTHSSIVPLYPEGTVFSGGLSKWCGAGGWRLGVFVIPDQMRWLLDAIAAVASETFTSTSAPIQHAAVRAFEGDPSIDCYLGACRQILSALGGHLAEQLRRAGAHVAEPEGGFYLFPDFSEFAESLAARGVHTSDQLCEKLLQDTGVAILPGREFGRPADELTARLAYVDFDGRAALQALGSREIVDEGFLHEYCHRTCEAVERLSTWLAST